MIMLLRVVRDFWWGTRRFVSTSHSEVRVRFAPSPTGFLHLGGLRTALYNFLFARQHQGSFILRLEDTDRKRLIPGAAEDIQESLEWAGLSPDEIYVQSERLHLYSEVAESLVSSGHGYHCFCTNQRLELLKREAQRTGQAPGYDNRCRHLLPAEVSERQAAGVPSVIRFRLNTGRESFHDDVFGEMEHTPALEGDPVMLKSDGFPTYTLASVVDDHHLRISHVLRGAEWLASTAKHLQVYQALKWTPPHFAHLPLLLGRGGRKLSKREGDLSVQSYRQRGVRPAALLDLLTHAGAGFENKRMGRRLDELILDFNVSKITTHSALLELDKLEQFSRVHLTRTIEDPQECVFLCEELKKLVLHKLGSQIRDKDILHMDYLQRVLHMRKGHISSLQELLDDKNLYLWIRPSITKQQLLQHCEIAEKITNSIIHLASTGSFISAENLNAELSRFSNRKENPNLYPKVMKALRLALSAQQRGPSVAEMMLMLGEQEVCVRLQRALEH